MSADSDGETRTGTAASWHRSLWPALVVLLLAALLLGSRELSPVGLTVKKNDGPQLPTHFPYLAELPQGTALEFTFVVHRGPLTARTIVFIPDDHFESLFVNGQPIPLDSVPPQQRDDYHSGFRFPLGAHLRMGDNIVVARVINSGGGKAGLDVQSDTRDWVRLVANVSAASALLILGAASMRLLGFEWPLAAIYALGVAVRLAYLRVTPFSLRTHDGEGHIEYVEYILRHHSLPGPYDGWVFYHPPLYYVLGALTWRVITSMGITSYHTILRGLQLQSMVYQLGFVAFGILTTDLWIQRLPDSTFGRRLLSRSGLRALCAALLCVWPSAIVHSARVGNDDLLDLCFGGGLYFVSLWWASGRDRDLNWAAIFGALGVVTKTNALLLFIVLAILLVVRFGSDSPLNVRLYARRAFIPFVLFLTSAGAALGRALLDTMSGKRGNLLVGNADRLPTSLLVANGAENYLWFDTKSFVTHAFVDFAGRDSGREFFWNYTFKTSLFGQFDFPSVSLSNLAVCASFLFLLILLCFLVGIAATPRSCLWADLPATVTVLTLVVGLAALRVSKPALCSNDFRYILPILPPFLYLYVRGVSRLRDFGWSRLSIVGAICGWSFAATSLAFFAILAVIG